MRLLTEMVAPVDARQRSWNEGWPQPAEKENGYGGGEVKGGQGVLVPGG